MWGKGKIIVFNEKERLICGVKSNYGIASPLAYPNMKNNTLTSRWGKSSMLMRGLKKSGGLGNRGMWGEVWGMKKSKILLELF